METGATGSGWVAIPVGVGASGGVFSLLRNSEQLLKLDRVAQKIRRANY